MDVILLFDREEFYLSMTTETLETPLVSPPLFDLFWEQHRQKALVVLAAIIALALTLGAILLLQRSRRIAAENLLSQSSDITGWQKVIATYPHSQAAANALLLVAAAQRQSHDMAASNSTYAQFLKKFPHHPLAISGMIGQALNNDSTGNDHQALNELQQAATAYPKSYGAPFALWMRARILARTGKLEEAKRTIQTISTQYPDSFITTMMLRQRRGQ